MLLDELHSGYNDNEKNINDKIDDMAQTLQSRFPLWVNIHTRRQVIDSTDARHTSPH